MKKVSFDKYYYLSAKVAKTSLAAAVALLASGAHAYSLDDAFLRPIVATSAVIQADSGDMEGANAATDDERMQDAQHDSASVPAAQGKASNDVSTHDKCSDDPDAVNCIWRLDHDTPVPKGETPSADVGGSGAGQMGSGAGGDDGDGGGIGGSASGNSHDGGGNGSSGGGGGG
ncbi:MAG TPA: hypothetical protein VGZ01_02850, partial [Trinickia sp.]|nr:hypothetical protein [Trinickia sp.]